MKIEVLIEKLDEDTIIPIKEDDIFQFRSDGILLNGELHMWEEILMVHITNRELLNKIKNRRE